MDLNAAMIYGLSTIDWRGRVPHPVVPSSQTPIEQLIIPTIHELKNQASADIQELVAQMRRQAAHFYALYERNLISIGEIVKKTYRTSPYLNRDELSCVINKCWQYALEETDGIASLRACRICHAQFSPLEFHSLINLKFQDKTLLLPRYYLKFLITENSILRRTLTLEFMRADQFFTLMRYQLMEGGDIHDVLVEEIEREEFGEYAEVFAAEAVTSRKTIPYQEHYKHFDRNHLLSFTFLYDLLQLADSLDWPAAKKMITDQLAEMNHRQMISSDSCAELQTLYRDSENEMKKEQAQEAFKINFFHEFNRQVAAQLGLRGPADIA
jgi:hypothetical protein